MTFVADGSSTTVRLQIAVTKIGPKEKVAAFGMKFGYEAYLDNLEELLAALQPERFRYRTPPTSLSTR